MTLEIDLEDQGLYVRGSARLSAAEVSDYGFDDAVRAVALVGNRGSSYWPHFSRSSEYRDGAADPLDRWSRRIASDIGGRHGLTPIYPFEGPPYFPFLQWAQRADALTQSPIGIMIHPGYGLWHSYRFALLLESVDATGDAPGPDSPCLGCESRPCLHSCPVDAFDEQGYAVDRCVEFLGHNAQAECHDKGCLARYSCPVALEYRYRPEQNQFHLRAFLRARLRD